VLRGSFLTVLSFVNFVAKKIFTRTSGVLTVHFMFIYSEFENQPLLISMAGYILYKHLNGTRWIMNVFLMYDLWWSSHWFFLMCFTPLFFFFHFSFKGTDSNLLGAFISSYVVMKSQIWCFRMGIKRSLRAFWSGVMFIWKLVALFQNQVSCLQRQNFKASNYTS